MRPTLFWGWGQGLDLRELENAPEMQKCHKIACSRRSDSGERCRAKKAMKSRGGLGREVFPLTPLLLPRFYFFALLFTSHRSPPSERLEQASPKTFVQDCRMLAGTLPCTILWSMLVIQTQLYIPFLLVLSQIQHVYHQAKMFEQLW